MSKSTDPEHFFQTDHSVAETRRKALKSTNKHGDPIQLQSKILAVIAAPHYSNTIFVAESTGTARRIALDSNHISFPYRGATAPVTCLALTPPLTEPEILFAGSWDKNIYSWHTPSRQSHLIYTNGHTDFVKAIATTTFRASSSESSSFTNVLISSGADGRIIVWAIQTGEKLHTLRPSENLSGGGLGLAILPQLPAYGPVTIFTANTLPSIRRFSINGTSQPLSLTLEEISPQSPISVHETSVYALDFDGDGDLWTGSADGDVTRLDRDKDWAVGLRIKTGGCVRGVAVDNEGGWTVSVGRDEEVCIWDRETGELHHSYSGHYDEILGVVILRQMAVTVGLDGTIRRWSLRHDDLEDAIRKRTTEEEKGGEVEEEQVLDEKGPNLMTEDEMRELTELLDE